MGSVGRDALDAAASMPSERERGRALFNALFANDLMQMTDWIADLDRDCGRLQLRFCFNHHSAELARYPWESLHDGQGQAIASKADIVRISPSRDRSETRPRARLRILLVAPALGNLPALWQSKARLLHRDHRILDSEEVVPPTIGQLRQCLNAGRHVDILAFEGYGSLVSGQGVLLFEPQDDGQDSLSGAQLAGCFEDCEPRLALLNLRYAPNTAGAICAVCLNEIALSLIEADIDYVVGVQGNCGDAVRYLFQQVLFDRLAAGDGVLRAFLKARSNISATDQGMVVLYARAGAEDRVLVVQPCDDPASSSD